MSIDLIDGQEFKVGHGGNECVRHLTWITQGVQIEAKVALRRSVHGAHKRKTIAIIIQYGNILRHGSRDNNINILGVRPYPGDDSLPRPLQAFGFNEIRKRGIWFQEFHDSFSNRGVSDFGVEGARSYVIAERKEMLFEELKGTDETGSEDCPNAKNLLVLAKATEQLRVHALVRVRAENGFIGAGVVCIGIMFAVLEL